MKLILSPKKGSDTCQRQWGLTVTNQRCEPLSIPHQSLTHELDEQSCPRHRPMLAELHLCTGICSPSLLPPAQSQLKTFTNPAPLTWVSPYLLQYHSTLKVRYLELVKRHIQQQERTPKPQAECSEKGNADAKITDWEQAVFYRSKMV